MKAPLKEHVCTHCGAVFNRNEKGIKRSGNAFCDYECSMLYHRGHVLKALNNVKKLSKIERMLLIELPLKGYNAFFHVNVKIDDFINTVENIASRLAQIPRFEELLFAAYYSTALESVDTRLTYKQMKIAFPTARRRVVNKYISKINRKVVAITDLIRRSIDILVEKNILTYTDKDIVNKYINAHEIEHLNVKSRIAHAGILYYIIDACGINVTKKSFSNALGVSAVSVRDMVKKINNYRTSSIKYAQVSLKKIKKSIVR